MKITNWIVSKFGQWLSKPVEPRKTSHLSDFEKIAKHVRPGDVLLIEGQRRVSKIIQRLTQSAWSHSVLYIGRIHDIRHEADRVRIREHFHGLEDTQLIIETELGKGTTITPLNHFRREHIRICRPVGLTYEDTQTVMKFMIDRLGGSYSVRHILDLLRFLFPWSIIPRKWRSSLFSHNALKPTEDICSSMMAEAFGSVKFPILPDVELDKRGFKLVERNHRLITPSDFDYSPYFAIIKYPIFNPSGKISYKNFPWKDTYYDDTTPNITMTPETTKNTLN